MRLRFRTFEKSPEGRNVIGLNFEFESCYRKDFPLCYGFLVRVGRCVFHLGIGRAGKYDSFKVWVNFLISKPFHTCFGVSSIRWETH